MIQKKFKNIFCINLDSRRDRWEASQKEFAKHGIEGVRCWRALDGKKIKYSGKLLPGEIGILKSLKSLIKYAKDLRLKSVVVLEDDVVFHESFKTFFPAFLRQLPEDWQMLYLGGNNWCFPGVAKLNKYSSITRLKKTVAMHAVVIRNTAYDKILEVLEKEEKQSDLAIAELHESEIVAYGFTPWLAFQRPDYSDIQNEKVDYSHLLNDTNTN